MVISDEQALSKNYVVRCEFHNFPEELRNLGDAKLKINHEVKYILGKWNVLVDYLSCNPL